MQETRSGASRGAATAEFDKRIEALEFALRDAICSVGPFEKNAIIRRIAQRAIELSYEGFLKTSIRDHRAPSPEAPEGPVRLSATGRLSLKPSFALAQVGYFLALIGLSFVQATLSLLRGRDGRKAGPAGLVADLGAHASAGGSTARLVDFIDRGPVPAYRECSRLIIQTVRTVTSTRPDQVSFGRWPVFELLADNPPSFREWLELVASLVATVTRVLPSYLIRPETILLARDFGLAPVWRHLNRRKLIEAVFLSDMNYAAQELFMTDLPARAFELHFVWHSQNVRGVLTDREPVAWEFPQRRYMRMDHAWYWTPSFGRWLDGHGIQCIKHAVGPILFQADRGQAMEKPAMTFRVCVFDVTPTHRQWQIENGWPYIHYNLEICQALLEDVLATGRKAAEAVGLTFEFILKHKRAFGPVHDKRYIEYVNRLEGSGAIRIIDSETDIFSLVRGSDLVVAAPFTSAALVGVEVKTPSVYYDPASEVWVADDIQAADVKLIQGRDALASVVERAAMDLRLKEVTDTRAPS